MIDARQAILLSKYSLDKIEGSGEFSHNVPARSGLTPGTITTSVVHGLSSVPLVDAYFSNDNINFYPINTRNFSVSPFDWVDSFVYSDATNISFNSNNASLSIQTVYIKYFVLFSG
jgi:hypothetical protein